MFVDLPTVVAAGAAGFSSAVREQNLPWATPVKGGKADGVRCEFTSCATGETDRDAPEIDTYAMNAARA